MDQLYLPQQDHQRQGNDCALHGPLPGQDLAAHIVANVNPKPVASDGHVVALNCAYSTSYDKGPHNSAILQA
jgi:hypothetical protein